MRILAISGSLRSDSHNTRLLRAAALALPPGVELDLYEGLGSLPLYDEDADIEPAPPAVAALRQQIAEADTLLISTPEYNASVPGVLKNAIDWASRPFPRNSLRDRPVAIAGTWTEPVEAAGGGLRAGFELATVVDRRDFGFDWQMALPGGGGDALAYDVTLEVNLYVVQPQA